MVSTCGPCSVPSLGVRVAPETHHALGAQRALHQVPDGDGADEGRLRGENSHGSTSGEQTSRSTRTKP